MDASNANSKNLKTGKPFLTGSERSMKTNITRNHRGKQVRNKPKRPFNKRPSYLLLNSWLLDSSWSSTETDCQMYHLMHQEVSACDWSNKPNAWTSGSGLTRFHSHHCTMKSDKSTGKFDFLQNEFNTSDIVQSHLLLHASPSERSSDFVVCSLTNLNKFQEYIIANECKINIRNGTSTKSHNHDLFSCDIIPASSLELAEWPSTTLLAKARKQHLI